MGHASIERSSFQLRENDVNVRNVMINQITRMDAIHRNIQTP